MTHNHKHTQAPTKNNAQNQASRFDFSSLPISSITGKPVLHFAHANGMPSGAYQPLFDVLENYFTVEYIPLLGATEGYPVDEHWQSLTQQVIDNVTAACNKHNVANVVAVGHSLGAMCTLQATYKNPKLFSQAVLFDPPWIYGIASFVWHVAKQVDKLPGVNYRFMDMMSPSGVSKHRRDVWDSREEAKESFSDKKFFAKFDERCLDGYILHGIVPRDDGKFTLAIPKMNEVAVFRTNPSWYWLTPNKPPKTPVTLIIGSDSQFMRQKFPHKIKSRLKIPFVSHQGGHMFPLEYPESVANKVLELCSA